LNRSPLAGFHPLADTVNRKFQTTTDFQTAHFLEFHAAAHNVKGERKLKHPQTYQLLLMAWPEIDAMLKSDPPKRMLDLWNWLAPFSYAGWIEITDLDPLVSLCQSIKLKLKKPGAPRKSKKC